MEERVLRIYFVNQDACYDDDDDDLHEEDKYANDNKEKVVGVRWEGFQIQFQHGLQKILMMIIWCAYSLVGGGDGGGHYAQDMIIAVK